jgi:hypothetical protein
MLSPQHWAQQTNNNTPIPKSTWCATYHDEIVLQWNQRQQTKTVKLDPSKGNTGTIWSAPGYNKYSTKITAEDQTICYAIDPVAYDEEDEQGLDDEPEEPDEMHKQPLTRNNPLVTDFQLNGPKKELPSVKENHDEYKTDPSAQMLQRHHHLSHISMKRIQLMAPRGQLPQELATCRVPLCQSCLYGKASRRRWRDKPKAKQDANLVTFTRPGQCVSVDQLESTTLGFFGQLKGRLTTAKYRLATIFVDHYSDLSYVYLQQTTSAKETLEAKNAFELYAKMIGTMITHYHADNSRFAENLWRSYVIKKGQHLTFCGVNAHHQNGRAGKKIRDSQDLARTSLIHASCR